MRRIVFSLGCLLILSTAAYADSNAFTPLNFNDTGNKQATKPAVVPAVNTLTEEAIGNGNIQSAITQLESAQSDIRNDLINIRTKYADVDAQYKLIKAERTSLRQQIRSIEKRINEIDKAKERIRRNML